MGAILVDGREVACDAVVRADKRYKFTALGKRSTTRAVVLHWTGGQGLAPQVFRTLQEDGLSVHFLIEPDGTVFQYADASLRCSHAGIANAWSVGIELTNPAKPEQVKGDAPRTVVIERIHGRDIKHTTFTAPQMASALALTESLCMAYELPMRVPMDGTDVLAKLASRELLDTWTGVLGHLHIPRTPYPPKNDPGLSVLRAVAALRPVTGFKDGEHLGPLREKAPAE